MPPFSMKGSRIWTRKGRQGKGDGKESKGEGLITIVEARISHLCKESIRRLVLSDQDMLFTATLKVGKLVT